jgi:uncharacterized protein (TIGR03435 family)
MEAGIMRRVLAALAVVVFGSGAGYTQTPGNTPKFDAADISVRARTGTTNQPVMTGGVLRGGRYDLRNATMVDLVATAYSITDRDLIVGGPAWLERDRFDIAAKAPQGTSPDNLRLMLQELLSDRFKLVTHKDARPMGGYVLTLGKDKHKLKEASGPGSGCQGTPPPNPPPPVPYNTGSCKGVTMEQFAPLLRQLANGYINAPVQDQTGLKGYWDFDVKFTPFQLLQRAGADGITIFAFVEQQLGLRLEQGSVPTPVTVVDSVNQRPTANPSGVSASIPLPPPMEFDVAEIKLSMPDAQPRTRLMPGGRIEADGITMQQIMQLAWDITTDELVTNTPKWWNETKYSVVAKTSTAVSGVGQNTAVDIEDLKAMLRQLITERFKLKTHYEDRPVTAYTLLSDKPKLAKADPANRTGFKEGPPPDQKDTRNALINRMVTVRNMSMAQFAEDMQRFANGYIRVPVEDKTGLEGAYDFTLMFSGINLLNAGRGRGGDAGPAAGGADALDPSGALSLFDAVNKQLGLKLEMRKRPMPVLVIDSIQEKPADN